MFNCILFTLNYTFVLFYLLSIYILILIESMKFHSHILGIILFLIISIAAFKLIEKCTKNPIKENYNTFNQENTCFDGKLSVPLPGRSKCFDCEREMIARNGCNINAGARGNSTRSFDANRQGEYMFGTEYKAAPSKSFFADFQIIGRTPQFMF